MDSQGRSLDVEAASTKAKTMELQQRLQMHQIEKEKRVLESVRRDLQRFQESMHANSGEKEKQHKQRESLLPPPPPPKKKSKPAPHKRKAQQRVDPATSSDLSIDETERDVMEMLEVVDSESVSDGIVDSEEQLEECAGEHDNAQEGSSNSVEDITGGESDDDDDAESDDPLTDLDLEAGIYETIFDVEESEGSDEYLTDSEAEENSHSGIEDQQPSLTDLTSRTELLPIKSKPEDEEEYQDHGISSDKKEQVARGLFKGTMKKANSKLVKKKQLSQMHINGPDTISASASKGMRGTTLQQSQREKRKHSSEFKSAFMNEIGEVNDILQTVKVCSLL